MASQAIFTYLKEHGESIVFFILFLEALNLTGIPAVVILPTIGILASQGTWEIGNILGIAILGSIAGNVFYYVVVLMIGPKVYDKIYEKFKGLRKSLDKAKDLATKYGNAACCIGRIIPGVRTVISLVAGTFRIRVLDFLLYSTMGIIIWDVSLIMIGYLFYSRI